jgi:prolyl-tRNA synthetase
MLLSRLFVKTMKVAPSGETSINAQLLIRWGFVHKEMAWVYTFLPLWLRVLNKIETIIRTHIDSIGTEIYMPCLSPMENREQSSRLDTVDVLMKTSWANALSKRKSTNEYILNPTHEDVVTPLAKEYISSYKDLPLAFYQIQSKFRNEARAKSGLLRGREFRMKDLYSFHATDEDFCNYYEVSKQVYHDIFAALGLWDDTYLTVASWWDFTEKNSHEFQTLCPVGEDTIYIDPTTGVAYNEEIAPSTAPAYVYDIAMKDMEDIYGEDVVSVRALCTFLHLPVEQTVKTMYYKDEQDNLYAAVVRWDYEVNELKLKRVLWCKTLQLISDEEIVKYTGAERGYAGVVNLPDIFTLIVDDACAGMVNFESGTNKTHYHTININRDRDIPRPGQFYDIKLAKSGDLAPSGVPYRVESACEVGNIFPLETKFSDAFGLAYQDESNISQPVIMGCYGIWPSRIMGVLVEKYHDDKGIKRPHYLAPFSLLIISAATETDAQARAEYEQRLQAWEDVAFDDRDMRFGMKMYDRELRGVPQVIIYGKQGREEKWR